jgi:hypothetical protein
MKNMLAASHAALQRVIFVFEMLNSDIYNVLKGSPSYGKNSVI